MLFNRIMYKFKPMKTLLACVLLLTAVPSFGCSIMFQSFCYTANYYSPSNILKARVIDTIPQGIRLHVIQVVRGTESRDTVTVWDAPDFECNGPFPMNASQMGMPGDTILAVMSLLDSAYQTWQTAGDYVRTFNFGYVPELLLKDDTLRGFIAGYSGAPSTIYQVWSMAYTDWLSYWTTHNNNCNMLMDIDDTYANAVVVYPNPANNHLHITGLHNGNVAHIFSAEKLVADVPVRDEEIDISQLTAGVYILRMEEKGMPVVRRFVKL